MHYYQFNIGDYRKDTIHLSRLEHGIYRDLIDWYYLEESPIPNETQSVIRRLRLGTESEAAALQNVLGDFFEQETDGFHHKRIDQEIEEYRMNCDKNRTNGKKGGRPRRKITQSVTSGLPVVSQTDARANPNQEPLTNNQEPYSVAEATGDKSPESPLTEVMDDKDKVFTYGVPMLTNAGTTDKAARSFLGGICKGHGDSAVVQALRDCIRAKPIDPLTWLAKALPPKGSSKPVAQPKTFAERDREAGWARWEEQTGRIHPDRTKANPFAGQTIDVNPTILEIS